MLLLSLGVDKSERAGGSLGAHFAGICGICQMRNNVVQLLYFFMEWNIVKSQRLVWSYTLCLQILIGTY